jgi:pSer/pThr/pTyr-binding forkhead associated (FHA) protein
VSPSSSGRCQRVPGRGMGRIRQRSTGARQAGYRWFASVDSDDSARRTAPANPSGLGGDTGSADGSALRFWLEYRGHHFELRPGLITIGRSASCQLVLDDALVSRRHAQIAVASESAVLHDLDSANGVFVNGERVSGTRPLRAGDRVVIGKQEMIVRAAPRQSLLPESSTQRFTAETLHGIEITGLPRTHVVGPGTSSEDDASESTHQGDALELLGGVADKVLALGRGEEAEKILATYLTNFRESARAGDFPEAKAAERAAHYAVKLAQATAKARWVDYAFDLYRILQRPLPGPTVDQLYTVLRNVSGVSLQGLRDYVATLRSVQGRLGPTDRFLVQRIEGLERLAASR